MVRRYAWLAAALLAPAACTAIIDTDDLNADTHKPLPADSGVDTSVDTAVAEDSGSMLDSAMPDTAGADTSVVVDTGADVPGDCKAFTYAGRSYYRCATSTSWTDAKDKCVALGMHLAKVDDMGEELALVNEIGTNKVWLGGSDRVTEGTWIWSSDGAAFTYKAWAAGEPNEMCEFGTCDYLVLTSNGWEDGDARSVFGAICEMP